MPAEKCHWTLVTVKKATSCQIKAIPDTFGQKLIELIYQYHLGINCHHTLILINCYID